MNMNMNTYCWLGSNLADSMGHTVVSYQLVVVAAAVLVMEPIEAVADFVLGPDKAVAAADFVVGPVEAGDADFVPEPVEGVVAAEVVVLGPVAAVLAVADKNTVVAAAALVV